MIYAGQYHTIDIRNFLIYYSKTLDKGLDSKLLQTLLHKHRLPKIKQMKKYVAIKDIPIYSITNYKTLKYDTNLKNIDDLIQIFLLDKFYESKNIDKKSLFNLNMNNKYNIQNENKKYVLINI